jgi:hypothetical protein
LAYHLRIDPVTVAAGDALNIGFYHADMLRSLLFGGRAGARIRAGKAGMFWENMFKCWLEILSAFHNKKHPSREKYAQ